MIAALFALAAAMLVAGVAAVVEGFPYVRLESGMAMVYGGSVVASSGLLLFGLAVLGVWLKRIEGALRLRPSLGTLDAAAPTEFDEISAPLPHEVEAPVFVPAGAGPAAERMRIEPSLGHPSEITREPAHAEPELPMPGLAASDPPPPETAPLPVEPAPADPVALPRPVPEGREAAIAPSGEGTETALRSSLDAAPDAGPERVVVGRYSSGGNTYMMFDDGAIEADTPNGRFTFASLDELKAFVDGGGEAGTRGAA